MGFILSIFIAVISSRFLLDYLSKTRPEPSPLPPWARFWRMGSKNGGKPGRNGRRGPWTTGRAARAPGRCCRAGPVLPVPVLPVPVPVPVLPGQRPGRPATSDQDDQRPATRTTSDPAGPGRTRCADHGTRRPDQGPRARVRGDQRRALPAESSTSGELYQRRALPAESSTSGEL